MQLKPLQERINFVLALRIDLEKIFVLTPPA